jgi:subfamily B ATP-binding cassette protein MsbA
MPMETTPPVNELAAATPLAIAPSRRVDPDGERAGADATIAALPVAAVEPAPLGYKSAARSVAAGVRFYKRILSYFTADWLLIGVLVALIWVALFAGVLEGAAYGVVMDSVLSDRIRTDWPSRMIMWPLAHYDRAHLIVALALFWLGLRALNDTVLLLREMINHRLRYNGTARVRIELFDHLQTLSPAYHRSRPQGDAIYRVTTDSQGFFGVLDTFIGAVNSVLTVVVIGSVMMGFNMTLTVVCLTMAPLLVLANAYFSRTIRRTSHASKQVDTEFTTFVQRAAATVSLAQLFGREARESARFRDTVDRTVVSGMRMSWQLQLYPWSQRVTYALGYAFILGYGGFLVFRDRNIYGPGAFTVGTLGAMLYYLTQLWEPIRRMTGFTADVQNFAAASNRVFHVMDLVPTVRDEPGARPLAVRPRTLQLHRVQFAYGEGEPPVLRGIDATILPGEMVAFVGPSGTGKSTLLNLLPRFYDPTGGSIALDGHDLRSIHLADVRRHIALVPQDSPVIAGTVAENIAFGRPDATIEQVRRAAELAGAAGFIEELPHGYDTVITEAGQNVSGGQRQRLAIARALLTDAPILVLDEPTSGLDAHHEHLVLQTLHRLKGHRTIVLVTHAISAVTKCDQIFVLKDGVVAESGTHAELLSQDGPYAAMTATPGRGTTGISVYGGER